MNETGRYLHFKKGQVLGIATKYREEKEKPNVSSVTTEATKQTNSPSDVLSTFNLDHVPTDKREPLEKLLKKNIDLFVQKDCELTSTNVTEMRINPRPAGPLDFPPPAEGGGAFERPPIISAPGRRREKRKAAFKSSREIISKSFRSFFGSGQN